MPTDNDGIINLTDEEIINLENTIRRGENLLKSIAKMRQAGIEPENSESEVRENIAQARKILSAYKG